MAAIDANIIHYTHDDYPAGGVLPSYSLRYGLTERVELGARYSSLASGELSVKLGLVQGPRFALAIAPRVTSTAVFFTPVYARVPVLATFQLGERVNLTPRLGAGFAYGKTQEIDIGFSKPMSSFDVHHPLGELGATLLVRVVSRVSLGLDIYGVSTFPTPIVTGGAGIGVLFHSPQSTQR